MNKLNFGVGSADSRLNLGAGTVDVPGYRSMDGSRGDKIYPLACADGTVDEIRASHVLEHFPHAEVRGVLADWVRALRPGGTLKIAVPDFGWIAEHYTAGEKINALGYVMGGQTDHRDFHKALFDESSLRGLLLGLGLINVRRWKSEVQDCAALPVSLNLAATKSLNEWPKVAAVVSMPRLGFNDFWACAYKELAGLRIPLQKVTGAYWDRDLAMGIERVLEEDKPEWILTCDYDTVFTRAQVLSLLDLAVRYPHADAIAPLQTARHHAAPMFTASVEGAQVKHIAREDLIGGEMLRADTAHFGLTLLRAAKLAEFRKPWFPREYAPDGSYGDGARDPDVAFWHRWKAAGNTLYVALRVPVGHCELMVRWPDQNFEAAFQRPAEFWSDGPPANVWR